MSERTDKPTKCLRAFPSRLQRLDRPQKISRSAAQRRQDFNPLLIEQVVTSSMFTPYLLKNLSEYRLVYSYDVFTDPS